MKRMTAVAGAVGASIAIAACGGSSHARTGTTVNPAGTTPTSTVDTNAYKTSKFTEAQAANAFTNAVTPVNEAIEVAATKLEQLAAGKTEDMAVVAKPVAAALTKLNLEMQALAKDYPVGADDLSNLEQSYQPLIVDFQDLAKVNASNYKSWEKQFTKDAGRVKAADKVVRTMLGLPANS